MHVRLIKNIKMNPFDEKTLLKKVIFFFFFRFQGFLRIGQTEAAHHQTHAGRHTDVHAKIGEHQ